METADFTKLFAYAVRSDKPAADLQLLLASGRVCLSQIRVKGMSLVHYAAHYNKLQLLQLLIKHGCNLNCADEEGLSPIHIAARRGSTGALVALAEAGARLHWQRPNCYDRRDADFADIPAEDTVEDPLSYAVENGHLLCVEALLRLGANPNCRYFMGDLVSVMSLENLLCLELLLRAGANPDTFNRWGLSPLMRACKESRLEAAMVLLCHKANVDLRSSFAFGGKSAMFYAMKNRRTDLMQLLLNSGADPDQFVQNDTTALELAIKLNSPPMLCCLLRNRADPNRPNQSGRYEIYPLQFLCSVVRLESRNVLLKLLLDAGARPNQHSNVKDKICLDAPCLPPLVEYLGCNEELDAFTVYLLVQFGAKINLCQGACGYTLLDRYGVQGHLSRVLNNPENAQLAELLLSAAVKVDRAAIAKMSRIGPEQKALVFSLTSTSLMRLCRVLIRDRLPAPLPKSVGELPLPTVLKNYLLFDTPLC
ncbi:hypothetical protein BOX15_Mlig009209g2 [Macrostomum lignano]|nr:hypothetical protein BOX15_Mlig009209g1 [Macrostomum lignano]PAA83549.1 hypothetical protein BOX15_Mlig009209g2 [Macrostomum lignano]